VDVIRPVTCQIFEGPGGAARRAIALSERSERSSALNQINDQDNDRNHEQQMD